MEISKTSGINVDYKDRRGPLSWQTRFFAEVILIDKTHSTMHPMIYRLKDDVVPRATRFSIGNQAQLHFR